MSARKFFDSEESYDQHTVAEKEAAMFGKKEMEGENERILQAIVELFKSFFSFR